MSDAIALHSVFTRIKYVDEQAAELAPYLRYASLNGPGHAARSGWLHRTFANFDEYQMEQSDAGFISDMASDCDVLMIGGEDVQRLSEILRDNSQSLNRKVKLVLTTGSTPSTRAELLNAGADDVFDVGRTEPAEAMARTIAIWTRSLQVSRHELEEALIAENLKKVVDISGMTGREIDLIQTLLYAPRGCASHAQIRAAISKGQDLVSYNSMKVMICKVRKRLRNGWQIVAGPQQVYVLKKFLASDNDDSPAVSDGPDSQIEDFPS
jgi:DNA-binding response OmpR family regulator